MKHVFPFYLYRFISRFYMYLPILAIILIYSMKLSYLSTALILAAHGVAIMVFKTPSGWLADRFPQKRLLILGELLKSLGICGLIISGGNLLILLVGQIISGLGFAFTSNTESALLFRIMEFHGEKGSYQEVLAKSQKYLFISLLIAGIIGSILATKNLLLPLYFSAPVNLLAALSLVFLPEPRREPAPSKQTTDKPKVRAWQEISQVQALLVYYAVNRATVLTLFVFVFPLLLFVDGQINLAFFGAILGLYSLTAFLVGNYMAKLSKLVSDSMLWAIVPLALICSILLMTIHFYIVFLVVPILSGIAAAMVRPLVMARVNTQITDNRAAVMSFGELLCGFLNALFLVVIAVLLNYSINTSLYIVSALVILINVAVYLYTHFKRTLSSKSIAA